MWRIFYELSSERQGELTEKQLVNNISVFECSIVVGHEMSLRAAAGSMPPLVPTRELKTTLQADASVVTSICNNFINFSFKST